MISNYLIYFYTLPKEEQVKQLLIILLFFLILFLVSIFLDFIISKFKKDDFGDFGDGGKNHRF